MIEKKKDFNSVLQGQINSVRGSSFEEDCIRTFISSANEETKIIKHLIMDYSILEQELNVYDAKTTHDIDEALKGAQESFDKISVSGLSVSVLSPHPDSRVIFHDEEKKIKISRIKIWI